jgi:hypothetical protein
MQVFALTFLVALTSALFDTVSGQCDGLLTEDQITKLNFFDSTVETNTLHEGGEIRYASEYNYYLLCCHQHNMSVSCLTSVLSALRFSSSCLLRWLLLLLLLSCS